MSNILLFAVDSRSRQHERASGWLEAALNGDVAVGLTWQTVGALVRISTHPRINDHR